MNGRRFAVAALTSGLFLVSCGKNRSEAPASKPNVLFLLIDALRADHLGSYGHTRKTSPRIDLLATQGVRFEQAHAQAPWTGSSLASILTGLYPSAHGVTTNPVHTGGKVFSSAILSDRVFTLPEAMQAGGYRTAAFVTNEFLDSKLGFAQGYDTYRILRGRAPARKVNGEAIDWLDNRPPGPFFLYLHYMDAHTPYKPPAPFDTMFEPAPPSLLPPEFKLPSHYRRTYCRDLSVYEALYDGDIRSCDEQVGDLLDEIDKRGLNDSTLIVVMSDHGEEFFEHHGVEHGRTLYEEVLRIPLVMRLPGRLPAGMAIPETVSAIDVYPTILELCGLTTPQEMSGRSLCALVSGSTRAERTVFAENYLRGRAQIAMLRARVKSIYNQKQGMLEERYLLDSDPREQSSTIARLAPEERRALTEQFVRYQRDRAVEAGSWASRSTQQIDGEVAERLKALGYLQGADPNAEPEGD